MNNHDPFPDSASSLEGRALLDEETQTLNQQLQQAIKIFSRTLGFDQAVILPIAVLEEESIRLQQWLQQGYHADMAWMENHLDKRINPGAILEGARSVVCLSIPYFTADTLCLPDKKPPLAKIARYARGLDYHGVIRKKLRQLLKHLQTIDPTLQGRGFTDSAPLLEKALAVRAGLGWQGKNSLIIHPEKGSWFFLAELLLNRSFADDTETETISNQPTKLPEECPPEIALSNTTSTLTDTTETHLPLANYCGRCRRCIDACPTEAIVSPTVVDANKCIAYWTIESNAETFPEAIQKNLNQWVFGCDICQEVCPWNVRFASETHESAFQPLLPGESLSPEWFLSLTDDTFENFFSKTPLKRTGLNRLKRNIQMAFPAKASSKLLKNEPLEIHGEEPLNACFRTTDSTQTRINE